MTESETNTAEESVLTNQTVYPSTPWNDSWEKTMTDPVSLLISGSVIWTAGVLFSQANPLNMSFEAPAATTPSIPGILITFVGFVLVSMGFSVIWERMRSGKDRSVIYEGQFKATLTPYPIIGLIGGIGTMAFIGISLSLTMIYKNPYYNNYFELIAGSICLTVFVLSYVVDISSD